LVYGFATTRVLARTTCTRNSVSSRVRMPSSHFIRTWPLATVLVSGQFTFVLLLFILGGDWPVSVVIILDCRFFALWKLKRRRISGGRTLNSSLSPTFASRFPTVLARPVLHSSQIGRVRSERFSAGDKRIFSAEPGASVIVIGHSYGRTMYEHALCLVLVNAKWLVHVVSTSDV
jgi:hypothetical protein